MCFFRYFSLMIITYVSSPRRFNDKMATIKASVVAIVERLLAMVRLPVETKVLMRGAIRVVPQVGQPAPRAMRPVMIPAFSRLAAFCFFFLCQRRTMRPMRVP